MNTMNEDTRQKSCEERIDGEWKGRAEDFRDLFNRIEQDDEGAQDELYEYPLAVSSSKVYRIDLSTGGPGDWLEVHVDAEDSQVTRIEYHFNDWFDHAQVDLRDEDFETAERFVSNFIVELM